MSNSLGQASIDVAMTPRFVFPLRRGCARSVTFEFSASINGNAPNGTVSVYLQDAVGGIPWKIVNANDLRVYPTPGSDYLTLIPSVGATGLFQVSLSEEILGVGKY